MVGHRNLDMDALGSAVGMQVFANNIIDQTYAVYDPHQMAADIERAEVHRLQMKERPIFFRSPDDDNGNESLFTSLDRSKTSSDLSKIFMIYFIKLSS